MRTATFPSPEQLLPHRGWMLLLTALRHAEGHHAVCSGRVPTDSPLVDVRGRANALLGLEMGAQCAGVVEALASPAETPRIRPVSGYLVRIRNARLNVPDLPAGRDLEVAARRVGAAGSLRIYEIQVSEGAKEAAVTGTLAIMAGVDPPTARAA